jgi:hypothetical protein
MGMQFVLLKPVLSFIPYLLEKFGVDYNGIPLLVNNSPNFHAPKLYIMFVANVSVCIAFYGLLCFYHGTEKELAWYLSMYLSTSLSIHLSIYVSSNLSIYVSI